jgi:hypothetical protein
MTAVVVRPIKRPQGGGQQPMLSNEDVLWAVEERRKGRRCKDIAEELHVESSTVSRWTLMAGYEPRPRHPRPRTTDPESLLTTMQLAGQGYSARDIATLQNLHPTSIRQRLRKHARDQSWRWRKHRLEETNERWPTRA